MDAYQSPPDVIAARRLECELDGLYFTRYFFKQRFGFKMLINWHHVLIAETLQKVIEGEIKRLIINVPPGYTKTELATINFIARGLAINPMSRYMHLSYSSSLALENSSTARGIIQSPEYQTLWPLSLKDDSDSKQKWWTEQGGGVYASSAGGQVTGFRAGHMGEGFTGALIVDDPVKPDDADYEERIRVNNRFGETIKSRLAHEGIPIIVIMQRIHKHDLSGYLLSGGSGEKWHHLNLSVYEDSSTPHPEYSHAIPISRRKKYGWLWYFKHSEKNRVELMSHKRAYYCQYMQLPELHKVDGALWTHELINQYRVLKVPKLTRIVIGVDPSGDDGSDDSKADAIGIIAAGTDKDGHIYILADSTTNGSPAEWAGASIALYEKLKADILVAEKNFGGAMVKHTIRSIDGGRMVRFKEVTASRGKILRAEPVVALYEQGRVHHVGLLEKLEEELTTYNGKGKSPNRLDALVWAVTENMLNYTSAIPQNETKKIVGRIRKNQTPIGI